MRDTSLPLPWAIALLAAATLVAAGCGRLDADDVINLQLLEARLEADPASPFERADVDIRLRLEAGAHAGGKTVALEWVRLFEGSGFRTNEPVVRLRVRLPEGADAPFEAGEVREVALEGYVPNDDLAGLCGAGLNMMVASRTSGIHGLVGTKGEVTITCVD